MFMIFLIEKFHPRVVIIGYDHRFGKGRQGDYHMMEEYAKSSALSCAKYQNTY